MQINDPDIYPLNPTDMFPIGNCHGMWVNFHEMRLTHLSDRVPGIERVYIYVYIYILIVIIHDLHMSKSLSAYIVRV